MKYSSILYSEEVLNMSKHCSSMLCEQVKQMAGTMRYLQEAGSGQEGDDNPVEDLTPYET